MTDDELAAIKRQFEPLDEAREAIGDALIARGVPRDVRHRLLATIPCFNLWAVARGLVSPVEAAQGGIEALAIVNQERVSEKEAT